MAYGDTQGIHLPYPYSNANAIPYDVYRIGINYYPNRIPLQYRLDKLPCGALTFYLNSDNYRPKTTVTTAAYTSAGTSLTVSDTTGFDVGDVLECESERFIVTAVANANTLTVTGAYEGTTQANHANNTTVTLITNARTGGEVDQSAISMLPATVAQYCQTVQHAYQVGGSLQSTSNFMDGAVTPLDRDRMMAMQNSLDDFERACYYGKGIATNATVSRPTMKGFKTLFSTNSVTSPTNASAYKPSDFTRDVLQSCFDQGGEPDTILVSTNFLTGFFQWGWLLQAAPNPPTALGVEVSTWVVPFLSGIQIVPAPLLASGTAVAFNSREVRLRIKRALNDYPRGRRGDAAEGDFIMEGAIEVENQAHHSWTSGVTGFAVQS